VKVVTRSSLSSFKSEPGEGSEEGKTGRQAFAPFPSSFSLIRYFEHQLLSPLAKTPSLARKAAGAMNVESKKWEREKVNFEIDRATTYFLTQGGETS
jgi:hypothetical protein